MFRWDRAILHKSLLTCVHSFLRRGHPLASLALWNQKSVRGAESSPPVLSPRPQAMAAQLSVDDLRVLLHLPINCSYQHIKNYFSMYGNSLLLIITNNSSFPSIIDKIWIVRSHTTISVYWVSIISFTVLVFFSSIKQNWKFVVGFMSLTLYSGCQCPSHVLWLVCVLTNT